MKNGFLILVAATAFGVAAVASAQTDQPAAGVDTASERSGMTGQQGMMPPAGGMGTSHGMMRGEAHRGMGPGMMTMMFIMMDTDGSETLSLEEVQAVHARMFSRVDENDDGEVTIEEMRGFMQTMRPGGN